MTTPLSEYVANWQPEPVTEIDHLDPGQANKLARTLNLDEQRVGGDELPIPWHWIYFPDWPNTSALGADGHPAQGHFLPPIPHRRRMFAGSKLEVSQPLRLGVVAEKHSTVVRINEKKGRSGNTLFVTTRSEYHQDEQVCLIEEQDIVYRSGPSAARQLARSNADLTPGDATWAVEPTPASTTLFRYSALTSNSHRIHYDRPYSSDAEGYPDLVVHGPLLATYMADLTRKSSGRSLLRFAFRLKRPVFLGDRFRVEANPDGEDDVTMRVVTGAGDEHVTATGVLT